MEPTPDQEFDSDLRTQEILLASSQHNISELKKLLRGQSSRPANVRDVETGFTPLHAAIAACEPDEESTPEKTEPNGLLSNHANGETSGSPDSDELHQAVETVRYLLQNGAIWNDLDQNGETPGCIARRLGLTELYDIMVDAGVRAEMLLSRLDEYERLEDEDGEENEDLEEEDQTNATTEIVDSTKELDLNATEETPTQQEVDARQDTSTASNPDVNSSEYLTSNLSFTADRLLDQDKNGVMMTWETEIMNRTASSLVPSTGLRILNIGHGMGIIDNFFREKSPTSHHIIEAHPEVLSQMKKSGWYEKEGVTIHEGKWQDIVPNLVKEGILFDAIYFDTFAEDYKALKMLFDEHLIGLIEDGGRWGFFNGLGADRQVCYDVYQKVVEMDLLECGWDVDWETITVPDLEDEKTWEGVRRPYWKLKEYKLPVVTFMT